MWKLLIGRVWESLEHRICRTKIYCQNYQNEAGYKSQQKNISVCSRIFAASFFSAFHHCGNADHLGFKHKENHNKYNAKYSWSDAFGLSSVLAIGYVVGQSIFMRQKLFEIDNIDIENWRYKVLTNSQVQISCLLNAIILSESKYILPISKECNKSNKNEESFFNNKKSTKESNELINVKEIFENAINEFSNTHNTILGELELSYGVRAIEQECYEDAIEHFTKGTNFLSAESMFNLALCYELGLGASADFAQAAKYYQKAANIGHADAMYNLGVFYAQGKGNLNTNVDVARQLFTEAAEKGQIQALQALQLEIPINKYSNLKNKYYLKTSIVNNKAKNNSIVEFLKYNSFFETDLNESLNQFDKFVNLYDNNTNSKNYTHVFRYD